MKGLILKDLLNIKSYGKYYGIVAGLMIAWGLIMKNSSFIAIYIVIMGGMLLFTGISLDEAVHFEKILFTMPISRRQYVSSKYVLLLILTGLGTLLGIGVYMLQEFITGCSLSETLKEAMSICTSTPIFLLTYAITLPIIFKKGVEKARYTYMLVPLIMGAGIVGLFKLFDQLEMDIEAIIDKHLAVLMTGGVLTGLIILWISYQLSLKFIQKREW